LLKGDIIICGHRRRWGPAETYKRFAAEMATLDAREGRVVLSEGQGAPEDCPSSDKAWPEDR